MRGISLSLLLLTAFFVDLFIPHSLANSAFSLGYFSQRQLKQYAQSITVRVFPKDNPRVGGSGVLISQDGNLYTVVTNFHVINKRDTSYQIQTPDKKVYSADKLYQGSSEPEQDIGFLVFYSQNRKYSVIDTKSPQRFKRGMFVIAGGFPFQDNLQQSQVFASSHGRIAKILNRPFIGGYQIGYTNSIINGMSGGPVLNYYGELIGINGMRQEPLFGNPYVFQDGSTISDTDWNEFSSLSWLIPVKSIKKLQKHY